MICPPVRVAARFRRLLIALIGAASLFANGCALLRPKAEAIVALPVRPLPIESHGTQDRNRIHCSSVMLLRAEHVAISDEAIALLEGHLISRDLKITSSAWTGRVVADPTHEQVEPASRLPYLERALVLAKGANAECVFQIFRLFDAPQPKVRYFVLHQGQAVMVEGSALEAQSFPVWRKRIISGPLWNVQGKLVAVRDGRVLAVVSLEASTVDQQRYLSFRETDGALQPSWAFESQFGGPEDLHLLRTALMDQLALEIKGPPVPPPMPRAAPGPGDLQAPTE